MTLTDTGPIVALIDRNEATHDACRLALPRLAKPMVTPSPCFTEAMYLLGRELGYPGQQALWQLRRSGVLTVRSISETEWDRMAVLMEKFRDAPMDLADASLVAAAETLGLSRVFTLDRHFYAYRLNDGSVLEVVP
jgi:predicted nucleic acid-binding protein